jgi:general secretion pathway protein C
MVRGLIIRQIFLLLDLVLFLSILGAASMVVVQLFQRPTSLSENDGMDSVAQEDSAAILADIRARKDYDGIVSSGLFGDAGRLKVQNIPIPEPTPADKGPVEETELKLSLLGVTSLSPKSIFASASIEDISAKDGGALYGVGDEVVSDVTLEEVYPRWVVLLNKRENPPQLERLSMDEDKEDGDLKTASRSTARKPRPQRLPTKRVELNKQELIKELTVNYADLVTKVKPSLYRDASGRVAGITAENISDVPLAKTLGLTDGDVLQTVNNEKIDSQQKILEMVQKYQNASSFNISILRDGKQVPITFQLK